MLAMLFAPSAQFVAVPGVKGNPMKTSFFRLVIFGLVAISALGCGSQTPMPVVNPSSSCVPSATPAFAYVLNGFTDNTVSMFTVNSCTGALSSSSPATVPTGFNSEKMALDPLGRFIYVANLVSNASDVATISMYTIDPSSGVLTPTNPPTVHTGYFPQGITTDPSGKFVYTANSDDNSVSMFTINQTTGVLTPTVPPSVPSGSSPDAVAVDPSGRFAYAANQDDGSISMYSINATTGVLTPLSPASVLTGDSPFQISFDPSGKFAYVPNTYSFNNSVSLFTLDQATGVLTPATPSAFVIAGNQPTSLAVDTSGKFAYVVNRADNTVSMFTIDPSNGNLVSQGVIATGGLQPFRVTVAPSGKFVYVADETGFVSIYSINRDGTLTSVGSANSASAMDVAITAPRQ